MKHNSNSMGRGTFSSDSSPPTPKKNNVSSHNPKLQTPSSPNHPGTDSGDNPHHQSRVNVRLSMLIKPSFYRETKSTRCTYHSPVDHSISLRHLYSLVSIHTAPTLSWVCEGNRSLTPVRTPSHASVPNSPSWRRVVHLPSNSPRIHVFFLKDHRS